MKAASQTPLFLLRLDYFNMVWEGQRLEASGFLACLYFENKHVRLQRKLETSLSLL